MTVEQNISMNKIKGIKLSQNTIYTIGTQCTIYLSHPIKTLKGEFAKSKKGMSESSPLRSDGS
jgi:hypothetical protein